MSARPQPAVLERPLVGILGTATCVDRQRPGSCIQDGGGRGLPSIPGTFIPPSGRSKIWLHTRKSLGVPLLAWTGRRAGTGSAQGVGFGGLARGHQDLSLGDSVYTPTQD